MGDTITGALIAIVSLIIGGFLSVARDRAAWRRETALAAGASAAETFDLIWAGHEPYRRLDTHLWKLRVQLELLGVSPATIDKFDEAARECRQQSQANYEIGERDEEGRVMTWIENSALEDLQQAVHDVNRELGSRWLRRRRTRGA